MRPILNLRAGTLHRPTSLLHTALLRVSFIDNRSLCPPRRAPCRFCGTGLVGAPDITVFIHVPWCGIRIMSPIPSPSKRSTSASAADFFNFLHVLSNRGPPPSYIDYIPRSRSFPPSYSSIGAPWSIDLHRVSFLGHRPGCPAHRCGIWILWHESDIPSRKNVSEVTKKSAAFFQSADPLFKAQLTQRGRPFPS